MSTIITIALLIYIVSPVVIYFTTKQRAKPKFDRISIDSIPAHITNHFSSSEAMITSQGFETVAYLTQNNDTNAIRTYLVLLYNREERDLAIVVNMASTVSTHSYVEFCTEFANGQEINTNNANIGGVYKYDEKKKVFWFSAIKDPLMLYAIHKALLAKHVPSTVEKRQPPSASEMIGEISQAMTKDNQKQVEYGRMYLDHEQEYFRPTLIGAYLMTWKLIWPISLIRRTLMMQQANLILKTMQGR